MSTLSCGDNFDLRRRYIKDQTVGVVYLNP